MILSVMSTVLSVESIDTISKSHYYDTEIITAAKSYIV